MIIREQSKNDGKKFNLCQTGIDVNEEERRIALTGRLKNHKNISWITPIFKFSFRKK